MSLLSLGDISSVYKTGLSYIFKAQLLFHPHSHFSSHSLLPSAKMKFFTSNVVILVSVATVVSAAPAELQKRACTNPVLRKNWNSATTSEQTNYVNAVKCLATKPSVLGTNATLYDDFTYVQL